MHYYQHNIKDFRSGVINFSREERWLYRDMLDVYYDTEKPLPLEIQDVCDAIGAKASEHEMVAKILRMKFNRTITGWVNERCEFELMSYREKAETARSNGKLGGRPRKNNPVGSYQVPNGLQSGSNPEPAGIPAETGSQANQEPITNNHKPGKQKKSAPPAGDAELFPGVDPQVVADFKALRTRAKAPITPTAMQEIVKQAELAGVTLEGALRICCARGWRGFKASWIQEDRRQGGAGANGQGTLYDRNQAVIEEIIRKESQNAGRG